MVLRYSEGYFTYFGIPIGLANFSPQMYDYANIALPAISVTLFSIVLYVLMIKAIDIITEKAATRTVSSKIGRILGALIVKKRRLFTRIASVLEAMLKMLTVGTFLYVVWTSAYIVPFRVGEGAATLRTAFPSISRKEDATQDLVIRNSNDVMIVKSYDTKTKKFQDGYKFIPSQSNTIRIFSR